MYNSFYQVCLCILMCVCVCVWQALILVINLIENSTTNCHKLESVSIDSLKGSRQGETTPSTPCNGAMAASRGSVLTILVQMFLTLCNKADSTVINVSQSLTVCWTHENYVSYGRGHHCRMLTSVCIDCMYNLHILSSLTLYYATKSSILMSFKVSQQSLFLHWL